MYIEFNKLPDTARVWVYQADRDLSEGEQAEAAAFMQAFLGGWKAHGVDLQAGFELLHDRFLVVGVDENVHLPSGCSIDGSARAVRELGERLGVDFFDRSQVPYVNAEGKIETADFRSLKSAVAEGLIGAETQTFNPQVQSKGQLVSEWVQPAAKSWLKKYF